MSAFAVRLNPSPNHHSLVLGDYSVRPKQKALARCMEADDGAVGKSDEPSIIEPEEHRLTKPVT